MKRETLRKLKGENCHYCGIVTKFDSQGRPDSATVEHLIHAGISPTGKKIGGVTNCVISCFKCNTHRNHEFLKNNPEWNVRRSYNAVLKSIQRAKQCAQTLEEKYPFLLEKTKESS